MNRHRELTDRLLVVVCLIFLVRVYVAEPYVVQTGSMAPHYMGRHVEAECPHCRRPGSWSESVLTHVTRAVCQSCGQLVPKEMMSPSSGDRVWVLKSPASSLHRWDVIALKCPDRPREAYVKRLVGMPGETLRLARGDVEILNPTTGRFEVLVKPDHAVRDAKITLGESRFVNADGASLAEHDQKQWRREGDAYQLIAEEGYLIVYPKVTTLAYNGSPSEQHVAEVPWADPILIFNFEPSPATSILKIELMGFLLTWELESGRCWLDDTTTLDASSLSHEPRLLAESRIVRPKRTVCCEMFWVDGRAQWSVGGEPVLSVMHSFPSPLLESSIGLEVSGKGAKISGLVLGRDIHYQTGSVGEIGPEYRLGEGEYLVLGDNSDVSEDSRRWKHGPGVPARLILGKVMGRLDFPGVGR